MRPDTSIRTPNPVARVDRQRDTASTLVVRSQELFGAHRELVIEHAGSLYHLRITQNDKLILTK